MLVRCNDGFRTNDLQQSYYVECLFNGTITPENECNCKCFCKLTTHNDRVTISTLKHVSTIETKLIFQFEIIINDLVKSSRFI